MGDSSGQMKVERTRAAFQRWRKDVTGSVGCVLTMGYLHAGHASLLAAARSQCDVVVATVFVNPAQFSPDEDFAEYPRDEEADLAILKDAGVDMVFMPTRDQMYPSEASVELAHGIGGDRAAMGTVVETGVGKPDVNVGGCESWVRPHFFVGVATVVIKFFNVIRPTKSFFGQKDYQQCCVVRSAVADLLMDVEIVVVPTKREDDGLAMSSRNAYLSPAQRPQANALFRAMEAARTEYVVGGEMRADRLKKVALAVLDTYGNVFELDYISIADAHSLVELELIDKKQGAVMAVAAKLGKTRLIDNMVFGPLTS